MAILPNMGLETPKLKGDSGVWDGKVNANFTALDNHDHTAGKGNKVPSGGININADLSFGGFTITSLGKLAFSAITAPTAGSKNLFVNSADNELYWRSNAGVNVKLTAGASINTSLVGGIVGDYSAVGAALAYDDTNKQYTFKDQSAPTKKWVRLASGPVRIYEHQTTESVYIEHATAAALAASYTITWPAALPGAAALVQISAAGVVSFSATLPANTVLKHASMSVSGDLLNGYSAGGITLNVSGDYPYASIIASATGWFPLRSGLREGDRVTSVRITSSGSTATWTLWRVTSQGGALTEVTTSVVVVLDTTLTVTTPAALAAGEYFLLKAVNTAGGPLACIGWKATFDRP